MIIRFGLDLDGFTPPGNYYNEIWAGPARLLDVLETRLGLKGKTACQARRILQYRGLLETAAAARPMFYSRSLSQDPFATAEVLLKMRDDLVEAGWTGKPLNSSRVADLAMIEASAPGTLAPGLSDRLRRLVDILATRSPRLEKVVSLDRPAHLPHLWRVSLEKLGAVYEPSDEALAAAAEGGQTTDLNRIQRALLKSDAGIKLKGDGSFLRVNAYSEISLAYALPSYLSDCRGAGDSDCWLIADGHSNVLDLVLERSSDARLGLNPFSMARAIPQVLSLALRLHWSPLDPQHLLEFLCHPVCPVQGTLRRKLTKAVCECPGTGNDKWRQAIEDVRNSIRRELANKPDELSATLQRIDSDITEWLEVPRHDPSKGAPAKQLAQACADVAAWAGARAASVETQAAGTAELFYSLASASADLRECLQGMQTVTQAELERLLEDVCGDGWCCDAVHGEAGRFHCIPGPSSIVGAVERILWWNCVAPRHQRATRWTAEERRELSSTGVFLQDQADLAAHENACWLRPVLAARKQLVLFSPRQAANEPTRQHPLVNRLTALLAEGQSLPKIDLDKCVTAGRPVAPVKFEKFPVQPLPEKKRWWKLNCSITTRDGPESFSSTEKFIFQPYAWVLRYKADLKPGLLWNDRLMSGARQKGVILHRMVDLLFAPGASINWINCSQTEFNEWLRSTFQKLVESEACNLLLLGERSEERALLQLAERTLWELITHFREAKVEKVTTAVITATVPFVGGQIEGEIDLLASSKKGSAVVDLKFGRYKEKRDELFKNLHLQLAVYSFLVTAEQKNWPASAYYILTAARLLDQNQTFFPRAQKVTPQVQPFGTQVCWQEFEKIWQWRRLQLDSGWVELTANPMVALLEPEAPSSAPPIPRWAPPEIEDTTYAPLTGWEAHQ